jgi:hypothetical protein
MESREERAARNEAVFREVNERIKEISRDLSATSDAETFSILCECSKPGCNEMIEITPGEYEEVRSRGDRFALVAGHEDPRLERVVEARRGYTVVEKVGRGAAVAEELDPRG